MTEKVSNIKIREIKNEELSILKETLYEAIFQSEGVELLPKEIIEVPEISVYIEKLRHTQQELADKFGAARPSLARILADLEKDGFIEVRNKDVSIKNHEGLRKSLE